MWEILLDYGTGGRARMKIIDAVFRQSPIHIDGALLWKFEMDSTRYLHIYFIKGNYSLTSLCQHCTYDISHGNTSLLKFYV